MALVLHVGIALLTDIDKVSKIALKIDYWTVPIILTPITMAIFWLAFRFSQITPSLECRNSTSKEYLGLFARFVICRDSAHLRSVSKIADNQKRV